jgi:hypothetical protein
MLLFISLGFKITLIFILFNYIFFKHTQFRKAFLVFISLFQLLLLTEFTEMFFFAYNKKKQTIKPANSIVLIYFFTRF